MTDNVIQFPKPKATNDESKAKEKTEIIRFLFEEVFVHHTNGEVGSIVLSCMVTYLANYALDIPDDAETEVNRMVILLLNVLHEIGMYTVEGKQQLIEELKQSYTDSRTIN